MSILHKATAAAAVVALAGVGGYGAARALSTDGPEPTVDSPVVVRPANDSGSTAGDGDDNRTDDTDDHRPGGDSHDTRHGDDRGDDDSGHGGDDRGEDDRDDDSGHGGDDLEPAHPTPNTFDDHDDDDDSGRDDDDDGGDDD